jgi:hypothetical protein
VIAAAKPGEEDEDLWHWHPKTVKSMADLFTFRMKYWFTNFGGSGNWKGYGDPSAELNFRSDLGLSERKGAPWMQLEIGRQVDTGLSLSMGMEYFFLDYAGESTFGQDTRFGGYLFPAGTDVDTTCRIRSGLVYAGFSPYLGHYFGGTIRLCGAYFWSRTSVVDATGGDRQDETIEFPLPLVGLKLYGRITKYLTVTVEAYYIEGALQEFKIQTGRLIDISGEVLFTPVPFVGIALGYRYNGFHVRVREDAAAPDTLLDLTLDGFHLSLMAHF